MTDRILACKGCGRTKPEPDGTPSDVFPSEHCGDCPPWTCDGCGKTCSMASPCSCWISLNGMATADIRALFAADGTFNVNPVIEP